MNISVDGIGFRIESMKAYAGEECINVKLDPTYANSTFEELMDNEGVQYTYNGDDTYDIYPKSYIEITE